MNTTPSFVDMVDDVIRQVSSDGSRELLVHLLGIRFGEVSSEVRHAIGSAPSERITSWAIRLTEGASCWDDLANPVGTSVTPAAPSITERMLRDGYSTTYLDNSFEPDFKRLMVEMLTHRFGPIDSATHTKIDLASLDRVQEWAVRLMDRRSDLASVFMSEDERLARAAERLLLEGRAALLCDLLEARFGELSGDLRHQVISATKDQLLLWGIQLVGGAESAAEVFADPISDGGS